jgi:uncharacterized protein (TIGR02145 family)
VAEAVDSSGFSGLPAGGHFEGLGAGGHFWSSTRHGEDAGLPTLHTNYASILTLIEPKSIEASLRCIMD